MVPGAAANVVVPDFRGAYAGVHLGVWPVSSHRVTSHGHIGRAGGIDQVGIPEQRHHLAEEATLRRGREGDGDEAAEGAV
jgi:hypothetical protein